MKVIDNFLPEEEFKTIQNFIMGETVPWFYNDYRLSKSIEDKNYQLIHMFYDEKKLVSQQFPLVEFCIRRLTVNTLFRVKANLNARTFFHRKHGYHTDGYSNITTGIYYLNTNNGFTKFKKGGKVKSVANRMVLFDSNLIHSGVTCTDEKRRVVINFNYA